MMKAKAENFSINNLFFILFIIITGLLFFNSPGTTDVGVFTKVWVEKALSYGLIRGYIGEPNLYPPLSFFLMGLLGKISVYFAINIVFLFKFVLFLMILSVSFIFYFYTKHKEITLLLHFSLILNVMGLGYIDVMYIVFLLPAMIMLSRQRLFPFTILFALSCLIKFQPLIIAPFIFVYLVPVRNIHELFSYDFRPLLKKVFFPTAIILTLIIVLYGSSPFIMLKKGTSDGFLSGTALNFNWIYTWFLHIVMPEKFGAMKDGMIDCIATNKFWIRAFPRVLFATTTMFLLYRFAVKKRTVKRVIIFSILGFLTYTMLSTGVHENHAVLICPLFALLLFTDQRYMVCSIIWMLYPTINLIIFYGINGAGFPFSRLIFGMDLSLVIAAFYFLTYIQFMIQELKQDNLENPE